MLALGTIDLVIEANMSIMTIYTRYHGQAFWRNRLVGGETLGLGTTDKIVAGQAPRS